MNTGMYDTRFRYRLEITPHGQRSVADLVYCDRLMEAAYNAGVAEIAYPGAKMEVVRQRGAKPGMTIRWSVRQAAASRLLEPASAFDPTCGTMEMLLEQDAAAKDNKQGDALIGAQNASEGVGHEPQYQNAEQ